MAVPTLYERVGGEQAVSAVVESLYERVLADALLAPFFITARMESVKLHQRLFLTHILGGPGQASPTDIRRAHEKHPIEQRHFYAVSDHMVDAFYSLGVDEDTIGEVISLLAPLSREIVNSESAVAETEHDV
jgi:hemoglobin